MDKQVCEMEFESCEYRLKLDFCMLRPYDSAVRILCTLVQILRMTWANTTW